MYALCVSGAANTQGFEWLFKKSKKLCAIHQFSFIYSFKLKSSGQSLSRDNGSRRHGARERTGGFRGSYSVCVLLDRAVVCWFVYWRTKCCDVLKSACYFG